MGKRAVMVGVTMVLAAAVVGYGAGETGRAGADLARVGPPRPGPAVLGAPPVGSVLLEHHRDWFAAPPTLISGTEAYDGGEYFYQDHLYDDFGAETGGEDPTGLASAGDVSYPTGDGARHGDNAADLVEFRVSTLPPRAVAYRFTLNTLLVPDSTMATVAFDTDGDPATGGERLPHEPGAAFPGTDEVVTTWGTGAEHSRWDPAGARWLTSPLWVFADLDANQITVLVPRSVSDPLGRWTATVAVGLHDLRSGGWLRPDRAAPSGIYNLAFRFDEPVATTAVPPDTAQAGALAVGEPTRFAHRIDFDDLAAGRRRPPAPQRDTQIRIFASGLSLGEGRDNSRFPRYRGPLQPYSLTVPPGHDPDEPAPLTMLLHSLTRHHWQYHGTDGLAQLGAARGAVVVTPLARGTDGWYTHEAEYDTFEAWADAARHVELDPGRVALAGYSMGGYGTYRLASLYPDLFGAGLTMAAPTGQSGAWLANTGHVPFLVVAGSRDTVVPVADVRAQVRVFDELGHRHRYEEWPEADHTTFPVQGYDIPGAGRSLGEAEVIDDPAQVTFVYTPGADDRRLGLVHDHAYWVSALSLAGPGGAGRIDAQSHARSGDGDAGGENRLTLALRNLGTARVELDRAGLDPGRPLTVDVTSDAAGTLFLAGRLGPGTSVSGASRGRAAAFADTGVSLPVVPGTVRYVLRPGRL